MIAKGTADDADNLKQALQSARPHVDAIFVTLTGTKSHLSACEKICRDFKVNVSYGNFKWKADKKTVDWLKSFFGYDPHMKEGDEIFLFDEARNFNFSQIPQDEYPWIMWMDTDDTIIHGENLRKLAVEGRANNIEAFYFDYLYQCDFDDTPQKRIKHVIIKHLRERLVRNIGVYKWIAPIHETLIEQRPTRKTDNYDVQVVHHATMDDRKESLTRNLKNLELAIYKTEGKDPRHIYYLAKAFYDINTKEYDDKLIPLILNHYIGGSDRSGWPEERSQAFEYLSDVYKRRGEFDTAIKAGMNALIEHPNNPSIYLNIAHSYMNKQEWERALFWVRIASSIPEHKTTLVVNPKDIQARTLEIIYNCSINMSKVDEAWAAAVKLVELYPEDANLAQTYKFIENLRMQRDVTRKIVELSNILKQTGERAKIKALLAAAPNFVQNNPFLINLHQQNYPPKPWADNEIAIYCGAGFTNWSPKKLENPGGSFVGGSEEAVILMAKSLQKQGWNVTVYCDPGDDEGVHDGVTYLPYYKFNRLDNFNILIAWRDIRFFDSEFNAKKTYLWAHDIQNPQEYTKERLDRITKIFFLSKWHRDNVPALDESKVFLTTNGI